MSQSQSVEDPKEKHVKPPLPEQSQKVPGSDKQMQPKADHGEQSYKGSGKLQGRKAVITGGDSGIGKAVAIAFAREGADVLIAYLNEEEDARDTAKWVKEAGRKAVLVGGDIQEERHCQQIVKKAVQEFGQIDILVNNAAFQMVRESITEIPSEEWDRTFKTNIYAMFYLTKAAVPHMPAGSAIINTASINSFQPKPTLLAYATTKGAIVNFTAGLAQSLAEKGIRANSVCPGPVWTPLITSTMPAEEVKEFGKESAPIGRPAQPVELAPLYVLLASEEASYISGAAVPVTGGKPVL
ncbi:MAG: SDR family oxidoreductase [Verrucomicrobia bacterium]|nr:SDR family oxidoreductase [Verrucomicrobiota bacterium]